MKRSSDPSNRIWRPAAIWMVMAGVGLGSCATTTLPCTQAGPGTTVVAGHNAHFFRRDWQAFRSGLADLRAAVAKQDRVRLLQATDDLRRSSVKIKSYSPAMSDNACGAFPTAQAELAAADDKLAAIAARIDWDGASATADELTAMSDRVRDSFPNRWFSRHRHGHRFY